MNYITKETIEPGEITITSIGYVVAEPKLYGKCRFQCELYDSHKPCKLRNSYGQWIDHYGNCNGFCYRWKNGDDIVFKKLKREITEEDTIVETKRMNQIRNKEKGI